MAADKGVWTANLIERTGVAGGKRDCVLLESDDFEHDVLLAVSGDFASAQQKLEYAQDLAARLTATRPAPEVPQLSDGERYFAAEFEVWQGDEMCASTSGPRDEALRDAMHYATQYGQDGPVRVFEVTRKLVTPNGHANRTTGAADDD